TCALPILADDLHPFRILWREDLQRGVVIDHVGGIDLAAVHLARHGGLGQARPDRFGHLHDGDGAVELALAAVGKGNRDHCEPVRRPKTATARTVAAPFRVPRRRAWWAVLGSNQ